MGLKIDPAMNILGAAAVLARDARATTRNHKLSSSIDEWYGAVGRYAGTRFLGPTKQFADTVFHVLATGVQGTASDGEDLRVPAESVQPDTSQLGLLHLTTPPPRRSDYPAPATFLPVGGTGFLGAARPRDGLFIRYLVIHDTDVDYAGTVRAFTDPGHCCAAHYVVDGEDSPPSSYPAVTQFVPNHDVAYHAGNYWYNQHAIGIEHVGFADRPSSYYTQRMYDTSASLVAYLADVYAIPIDRAHILAHGNVPALTQGYVPIMHWDPGPFWDWPYYLSRVRYYYERWTHNAPLPAQAVPAWAQALRSRIRMLDAYAAHAAASDIAGWSRGIYANFTPVHADDHGRPAPGLVLGASDPATWQSRTRYDPRDFSCANLPDATKTGGGAWTLDTNSDLRAKAEYGEAYALLGTATVDGVTWDEINFGGVKGWIRDSATTPGWGVIVTFVGGAAPTTLYGAPVLSSGYAICPDASSGFSRAGQSYVAQNVYVDATGATWYEIYYNHRLAWVPASEVAAG
jgi:N-acetyl-anhydromuramyl-L-alanine amidase AmpD